MISIILFACLIARCTSTEHGTCTNGYGTTSKVFKAYDINNDGAITRNEGIEIFKRSDANSNGVISPDEFSSEWNFYHNDVMMPFFATGDKDNDGVIDFTEGNQSFDYFDNNGDNVITWQEFYGTWAYLVNQYNSEK